MEKVRDRTINVGLPLACPLLGTWPATQACVLTGNQTSNPLVWRLALNPLSHTSQGCMSSFKVPIFCEFGNFWFVFVADSYWADSAASSLFLPLPGYLLLCF